MTGLKMTPILRAEGAGGTIDSPMVILSTLTLLKLQIEMITMNSVLLSFIISLCWIIHMCIFSTQASYFLQSHFLIICVGDIEI